jgi:hypothetical protein
LREYLLVVPYLFAGSSEAYSHHADIVEMFMEAEQAGMMSKLYLDFAGIKQTANPG